MEKSHGTYWCATVSYMTKLFTVTKNKLFKRCFKASHIVKYYTYVFYAIKFSLGLPAASGVWKANTQCFQNQLCSLHQETKINSPITRTETVLETLIYSPFTHLKRLVGRESFAAFNPRKTFRSCNTHHFMFKNKAISWEKAGGNNVQYPSIKTLLILLRQYVPFFSYYLKYNCFDINFFIYSGES